MATKLSNATYYENGVSGASTVIGWESKQARVVRFDFTTGSSGATSIKFATTSGTISHQNGTAMTKIPFYVTTSSSSHKKAVQSSGSAVTGYMTKSGDSWSGSASILLKENTKYYVWFFPYNTTFGWAYWHNTSSYYTTYETSGTSKYTLSVSAGTGSTIKVDRTTSALGSSLAATGVISNGASVYKGDKLKITFTPGTNYGIDKHTVNGNSFTSGNVHTVSGNVTVQSTAYLLASKVGATDANIGSRSSITITKYNTNYYHSLQYSFGGLTGYITSDGGIQTTESKFSTTSVSFLVPEAFYAQIPNAKTGNCTITCRTYGSSASSDVLGNPSTCKFVVTAAGSPSVSGSIIDTDQTAIGLTGDSSILIRYKSDPKCVLTATPKNASSISSVKIRGTSVPYTVVDGVATATSLYIDASYAGAYTFEAVDSRGYATSVSLSPTVIDYIQLTCNPTIYRATPTGSTISMSVSGSLYRGSFGAVSNTITLDYRYKISGGSFSSWETVPSTDIVLGASKYTVADFPLGDDFDYKSSYTFEVRVRDGSDEYALSTITKTVDVQKGVPVFDWGENDFAFNVPVTINGDEVATKDYVEQFIKEYLGSDSAISTLWEASY